MENNIFINYRRSDTEEIATELYQELTTYVGQQSVFFDRDGISGGENWPRRLQVELESARFLLTLIGPTWLEIRNEELDCRRIDHPEDWVRREIEVALEMGKIILPILVEGASIPQKEDLPNSIQAITNVQVLPLSRSNWKEDLDQILKCLGIANEVYVEPSAAVSTSLIPSKQILESHHLGAKYYLKKLIDKMEQYDYRSASGDILPYIDLAADQKVDQSAAYSGQPSRQMRISTLPRIQPSILELKGFAGAVKNVSEASNAIGLPSKKINNVLSTLRKSKEPIILLGEPGSGKSMTVRELTIQLALQALKDKAAPLPIYLELGTFRQRIDIDSNQGVLNFILEALPPGMSFLRSQIRQGEITLPLALIFDAMDEMPRLGDYNDRVLALSKFAEDYAGITRTIFACRTNDFNPAFGHRQLIIHPFDEGRIRSFLKQTLGKRFRVGGEDFTTKKAARKLLQANELGEGARNPLTLSLAVNYILSHDQWPRGRTALLEDHLLTLAHKAYKRKKYNPSESQIQSVVDNWSAMAYEIFKKNGSVFSEKIRLEALAGKEVVALAISGGVIIEDFGRNLLKFRHHRLQEYLVARYLHVIDTSRLNWQEILLSPRWQETMLNYFSIGGKSPILMDFVLSHLHKASDFFESHRQHIAQSQEDIKAAEEAYRAIEPDTQTYHGAHGGGWQSSYSPAQQARRQDAQEYVKELKEQDRLLRLLPFESELEWSEQLVFTARLSNRLLPDTEETINIHALIRSTMEGLVEFGRPAIQVRLMAVWREISHWCPRDILKPIRDSDSNWVRSQIVYTLLNQSATSNRQSNLFYINELERELLNLNLGGTYRVFQEAAAFHLGRKMQLGLSLFLQAVLVIMILASVALTGIMVTGLWAFPGMVEVQPFFQKLSPTLKWISWLGLVGFGAVLLQPVMGFSVLLRVVSSNVIVGGLFLGLLPFFKALFGGQVSKFGFNGLMQMVLWSVSIAMLTAVLFLLFTFVARGIYSILLLSFRKEPKERLDLPVAGMVIYAKMNIVAGIIIALLCLLITTTATHNIVSDAFMNVLNGIGAFFSTSLTETIVYIIAGIVVLFQLPKFADGCLSGWPILLIMIPVQGLAILAVYLIHRFTSIMDWLTTPVILGIGFGLPIAFMVLWYVGNAIYRTFGYLPFAVKRGIQKDGFKGSLQDWEASFEAASPFERQDLIRSFDHRQFEIEPKEGLGILHSLEKLVKPDDPSHSDLQEKIYHLQEALRQKNWTGPESE